MAAAVAVVPETAAIRRKQQQIIPAARHAKLVMTESIVAASSAAEMRGHRPAPLQLHPQCRFCLQHALMTSNIQQPQQQAPDGERHTYAAVRRFVRKGNMS